MFTMWSVILDSAENFLGETGNFGGRGTFPPKAWIKPWVSTTSLHWSLNVDPFVVNCVV